MLGLIPFTAFAAFLALYGPDVGLGDTGPVFFAYAGMVLAIRLFGAKLPDKLGGQPAFTIALAAVGFGGLLVALGRSGPGGAEPRLPLVHQLRGALPAFRGPRH